MGRGEYTREGVRCTVDHVLALDVRQLSRGWLPEDGPREHAVTPSVSVALLHRTEALILEKDREETAGDPFLIAADLLDPPARFATALADQFDPPVGEDTSRSCDSVKLDSTPCNYGGERYWWLCPKCGRRCAILYNLGLRFECRKCCELTYTTAQCSRWIRSMRKTAALHRRIGVEKGADGALYAVKPKGMHWRTFERLVAEYRGANAAASAAAAPMFDRWDAEHKRMRAELDRCTVLAEGRSGAWANAIADAIEAGPGLIDAETRSSVQFLGGQPGGAARRIRSTGPPRRRSRARLTPP